MRVRAIKDLAQLPDSRFFAAVAEGAQLVFKNVNRLQSAATRLAGSGHGHAARVLGTVAEEEAAKVLVLLDAVRCPRHPSDRLVRQLSRFNDHLAKGLYARSCGMRPTSLAELQRYLDDDRADFYLDGPNEVDWIFRNAIIDAREGTLYVDYVQRDDGHHWTDPGYLEDLFSASVPNAAITLCAGFYNCGVLTRDSLQVVADIWRLESWSPSTWSSARDLNLKTLQELDRRAFLQDQDPEVYGCIVRDWQFPMYDLDLSRIVVDPAVLREQQRDWNPDY